MKQSPFFSIVIPTLNEEEFLPLLLSDLASQSYKNFEVLHVDANSEDKTLQLAAGFSEKIDITSFSTEKRNVSFQRNLGINNSRGNWILFIDADVRIPTYFLDGIRYRIAQKPTTDIFTTWVKVAGNKKVNQSIEKIINFAFEFYNSIGKESAFGAMIGVKTHIAKNHPFDISQKVMEDSIFVEKIVDDGNKFSIFKDPRYTYSIRRLESSGILDNVQTYSKMIINYYLKGNDFKSQNFGYEMNGGNSYVKSDKTFLKMLSDLEKQVSTVPKQKIKTLLNLIKDSI